jgi:hypothetical protein
MSVHAALTLPPPGCVPVVAAGQLVQVDAPAAL